MAKDTLTSSSPNMQISKKDAYWSYLSQFLSISSGIFVLPIILNKLSSEEIGLNYILLTLTSLVSLFDFGFSPQFGRNIVYVFNGVTTLKKEGVDNALNTQVDYHLLATVIRTAQYLYRRLAIWSSFFLLTIGGVYIYQVTDGFQSISQLWIIWGLYVVSTYFNVYFLYYNSLLIGKGLIKESQKATIASKCLNICISISLLFAGFGLLSVVIANLVSPFAGRYISYYFFYTKELKNEIMKFTILQSEIHSTFKILWYNAKKIGLVSLASFAVSQLGLCLSGLYLPLNEVASYGLMVQLVGVISVLSGTLLSIQAPYFAACRVQKKYNELIERFAGSLVIFYILFIAGSLFMVAFVPLFLHTIRSNAILPSTGILIIYSIIRLLECNHAYFGSVLLANNSVPFVKAALFSGLFTLIGLFIVLHFTHLDIVGLVIIPGIAQGVYQNWKWPKVVCDEFCISYFKMLKIGYNKLKLYILKK